ncbi:catalase [Pseudoxanthomonas sp. 10H]|uniref:catalase n=1 Tax=Pseudoxanthomonas sp. 10H TaxID=3242729 RepID=UPI00355615F9
MASRKTPTATAPGRQPDRTPTDAKPKAPGTTGRRAAADPDAGGPRGAGDELQQQAGGSHPPLTTNQGVVVADNQNSLTATPRGPTLLEDFILREKITHFDHERIPERIVHARGSAAHGYFELTRSLKRYTTARLFTEVGVRTPVFARFSTVAGGAGSVDTPRDVRGFAVKFYTDQGNYDLVGNNVPVFFIQDAMKFPDLVHSVKMEPDRGFPQATAAHDTFWDFISLTPESMHMVMWAMSDRTIPRSLRMMEGFGVHSFRFLDKAGNSTFVKFHWRPKLGLQSTVWDEAMKLQAADNDYHRRDLFEAIQAGAYPEWELGVQLFTEEQAAEFPFDHLDPTKIVPEALVPVQIIGRMVLDRCPDNFFAETEQVAFCPANLVPGIDFSNDPLLQGRLFSYLDTQLIRLGGPNFQQIPINQPRCPFANHQRDGHMQMQVHRGRVNYEPSSLQEDSPRADRRSGFRHHATAPDDGAKGRVRPESFADHYSQARMFFTSLEAPEQAHLASALVFELSKVETPKVRERMVGHLRHIDADLARRVADGLGLDTLPPAPQSAVPAQPMPPAPEVRVIGRTTATLEGRSIGILFDEGSDARTLRAIAAAARDAGATVKLVAPKLGGAVLSDGRRQPADGQLAGTPSVVFDAVAVVLSPAAGARLARDSAAVDFVAFAFAHLKAIAHDEGAAPLLARANVEPDAAIVDAGDVRGFLAAAAVRQWDREPKLRQLA